MDSKSVRAIVLVTLLVISLFATGTVTAGASNGDRISVGSTPSIGVVSSTDTVNNTSSISVSGTVSDHTGTSVSGMRVGYHNDSGYVDSNVTSNGTYDLSVPSNDSYQVFLRQDSSDTAFADDGVPDVFAYDPVNVSGDTIEDIQLPQGHDLTVEVVNASGSVIEDASVYVSHRNGDEGTGVDGSTNPDGLFVPEQASSSGIEVTGTVHVSADASGYASTAVETTVNNATTLQVELQEATTIDGTITSASGDTASADRLEFDTDTDSGDETIWTDENGSFSAAVAKGVTYQTEFVQTSDRGNYTASFPQDGIPDVYSFGTIDAADNFGTVELPDPSNLTVNVVGPNDEPLSDVPITFAYHESGQVHAHARGTTGTDGTVTIEAVGELHISADPERAGVGDASTDVTLNGDREITLELPKVVTASGELTSAAGVPVTGDQVIFSDGYDPSTNVRSDGSFAAEVATNNDYDVVFQQRNYNEDEYYPKDGVPDFYAVEPLSVGTNNVSLGATELPEANRLNVTVENQSGEPLANVPVFLEHENNGAEAFTSATTNDNGLLVLDRASTVGVETSGTLNVDVNPSDAGLPYVDVRRTVEVTDDKGITITVDPAVDLTGSVTYGDKSVPEGYTMHAWGEGYGDSSTVQSDGNYSLSVRPNSAYEVVFKQRTWEDSKPTFPKDDRPDIYAVENVDVSSTGTDIGNTTLPTAHQLNVTVVNESGAPVSGVDVDVSPINGDVSGHHDASTNRAGEVILDGAASAGIEVAGKVRVSVSAPDGSRLGDKTETYTLEADRNETIELAEAVPVTGHLTYADGTNASGYVAELWGEGGTYELTNADGTFDLLGAPNQTYPLGFKQTDFDSDSVDFPKDGRPDLHAFAGIDVGTEPVDIGTKQLPKAHMLDVTVENGSGAPVSGLEIDVTTTANEPYTGMHASAATNENGSVVLDGAASPGIEANGTIRVTVKQTGQYPRASKQIEVNQSRDVTITLEEFVTLEGSYLDADGNPLNNSFANAVVPDERFFPNGPINDTGHFDLTVAPNETYQVGFVQRDANGNFGPHDGVVDLYRTTAKEVSDADTSIGTHEIPNAAGIVNVKVVNKSGAPVQGADVGFFPKNDVTDTYAVGWVESTDAEGYYATGDRRGMELNGSVAISVMPPAGSEEFVDQRIWRNITVTGDRTIEVTLEERPDKYPITGTWEYPNGSGVADTRWVVNNFAGHSAGGQTNASGSFTTQIPSNTNETFGAWVYPMETGDGIVDVWNTRFNATGGAEFTERLPSGYEVTLEATTASGETADTIIQVSNNVNASATGWYYEYGTGRALDPPTALGKNPEPRPWLHVETRDLASGTHNATVFDAWTHDVITKQVITVDDAAKTVSFDLDRYPSVDQSNVDSGTVARDIEAPGLAADTTDSLLSNGFNVRLTVFDADSSTDLTITEQMADGYALNESYGDGGITYDGSGSVAATYDNETDTLTLDVTGEVSDIRYRVVPEADGRDVAVFAGTAGDDDIQGETVLGDAPLSGTVTLSNGEPATDAVVIAQPLASDDDDNTVQSATDGGEYRLPVPLGSRYAVGYNERPEADSELDANGHPDLFSIGTANVTVPTTLNASLPAAHNVTFRVVDSDGDPVGDEWVDVSLAHHAAGFDSPAPARLENIRVGENGTLRASDNSSHWELTGNVTVTAMATSDVGRFTANVTEQVTIADDQNVTIQLPEEQQSPNATVNANNTSVLTGDTVFVSARNSTDNSAIAAANWTVTGPNGETQLFRGPNATFDATTAGTWDVSVTVTDVAGNTDTASTTVTVQDPANVAFDYTFGANASDGELTTTEAVTVTATATNDGDVTANETVAFVVDGEVVESREITLKGGESITKTFTTSLSQGTHDVGVRDAGTTVLEVFEPADLSVTYDTSATEIFLSDILEVTATVSNDGGVAGTQQVALVADNETVATTNVSVASGDSTTVDFAQRFSNVGTHNVTVNGLTETPVSVEQATNPSADVTVTSPAADSVVGSNVTVGYSLSNTSTGIAAVEYSVDGGSVQTVTDGLNASSFEVTLAEGPQTVTMWLRDNAGNRIAETERTVTVDTTEPSVSAEAGSTVVGPDQTVDVNVTVADATLDTTTLELVDQSDTVVETVDLTGRAADGQATATVDALSDGSTLESGNYTVRVTATDEADQTSMASDTVTVDTTAPNVSEVDASGTTSTAGTAYLNASGKLSVSGEVTDDRSGVPNVTVVAVSQTASYNATKKVSLDSDGTFDASLSLGDAPSGPYTVAVRATDAAGNTFTETGVDSFTYDDTAPTLGVSVSIVNATDGRVTVTSDEPLANAPTVTIAGPDPDTTKDVQVTETDSGVYTTTFGFGQFGNDGTYTATVTGSDLAGQSDTANSTASVQTAVEVENSSALIETGDSGTFINLSLDTNSPSSAVASLSSSDTPLAELAADLDGSQFIEGELGDQLSENLTSAEIGIPKDDVTLGLPADQVEIRFYNETAGTWETLGNETNVETRTVGNNTQKYFVVNVSHFSTYGALAADSEDPTIDDVSLSSTGLDTGATYDYSTDTVETTVKYSDDVAGINASAVEVYFNEQSVETLADVSANVNSSSATVTATGLVGSGENNVTVVAVDEAGKTTENVTKFTVEQDMTKPTVTTKSVDESGETLPYGTTSKTLTVNYSDTQSGVELSTITASVNGTEVDRSETAVDDDKVTFDVTGLQPGDTKQVTVNVTDAAGNKETLTRTFSVATDTEMPTASDLSYSESTVGEDTFAANTSSVTATLPIDDSLSGIDASAVTVEFGPKGSALEDVTTRAEVTDGKVEYTRTDLQGGTTYVMNATLVDEADNTKTVSRTFTVKTDDSGPTVTKTEFTPSSTATSPTFDLDTDDVTIDLSVTDATGVNTSAVTVKFGEQGSNLQDVTRSATMTGDTIRYNNDSLEIGTKYNLTATLVDGEGNENEVSRTFTIAGDNTAPVVTDTTFSPAKLAASPTFEAGTESVSIDLAVSDETTVDTSAVVVKFGEKDELDTVTADVSGSAVSYDATDLENGTTYEIAVTLVDGSDNQQTVTRAFSVASASEDSGDDTSEGVDSTPPRDTNDDDQSTTTPDDGEQTTTTAPADTTTTPNDGEQTTTTAPDDGEQTTTTAGDETSADENDGNTGGSVPGFTGVTTLVALIAAAVLTLRGRE
jgi:hypothetical protein